VEEAQVGGQRLAQAAVQSLDLLLLLALQLRDLLQVLLPKTLQLLPDVRILNLRVVVAADVG